MVSINPTIFKDASNVYDVFERPRTNVFYYLPIVSPEKFNELLIKSNGFNRIITMSSWNGKHTNSYNWFEFIILFVPKQISKPYLKYLPLETVLLEVKKDINSENDEIYCPLSRIIGLIENTLSFSELDVLDLLKFTISTWNIKVSIQSISQALNYNLYMVFYYILYCDNDMSFKEIHSWNTIEDVCQDPINWFMKDEEIKPIINEIYQIYLRNEIKDADKFNGVFNGFVHKLIDGMSIEVFKYQIDYDDESKVIPFCKDTQGHNNIYDFNKIVDPLLYLTYDEGVILITNQLFKNYGFSSGFSYSGSDIVIIDHGQITSRESAVIYYENECFCVQIVFDVIIEQTYPTRKRFVKFDGSKENMSKLLSDKWDMIKSYIKTNMTTIN